MMQALRRLVLAGHRRVPGIAGASAVVQPQKMEVACTAAGAIDMGALVTPRSRPR